MAARARNHNHDRCCVPQCTNDSRYTRKSVSFHVFPKDETIRQQWIDRIRKDPGKPFKVTEYTKVCSVHFLPSKIRTTLSGHRRLVKNAVPTVFFGSGGQLQHTKKFFRILQRPHELCNSGQECKRLGCPHFWVVPYPDHDYIALPSTSDHLQAAVQHIDQLEAENQQLHALTFGVSRFSCDPEMIRFYTGFDDYKQFRDTFLTIQPTNDRVERQRGGPWDALRDALRNEHLPPIDQFFVFLCRCRAGLYEEDLAVRFNISVATVNGIIAIWTDYLQFLLASLPIWPSRQYVDVHMPDCFKCVFPRIRVIVECIKIGCQVSSPCVNDQLWSFHKSSNTLKGLVGITPCGAVSFVSQLYAGDASNLDMAAWSGLLDLLDEDDSVIFAGKVLTGKDLHAAKDPLLNIDPFLNSISCPGFWKVEVDDPQSITRVQNYIQRAVSRVTDYCVFASAIPPSLTGSISHIWTICCLLTNFKGPLK